MLRRKKAENEWLHMYGVRWGQRKEMKEICGQVLQLVSVSDGRKNWVE